VSGDKKILIIYPVDFSNGLNTGIYDKMIGQGIAYEKQGFDVDYAYLEKGVGSILQNNVKSQITGSWPPSWAKYHTFFKALSTYLSNQKYEIFHIRHLIHTHSLLSFLKKIKSKTNQIFYEYPTLPYEREWRSVFQRPILLEDRWVRKRVEKYFDKVIHYGGYLGHINSVQITNGINSHSDLYIPKYSGGIFTMVAVGRWDYWHGLDRIIKGLRIARNNIEFIIVGNGPSLQDYKSLVANLGLENKVSFCPSLYGERLEKIISKCHLGIGTLAIHRKNVILDSSLKHRMYCSYGLPFIYAGIDNDFNQDLEFVFKAVVDESPIDINQMIDDYKSRNIDLSRIKNYAETHLSWDLRIKKIIGH
jgi:glycosyltransferase involved in cell wall biosynthesis